MDASQLMQAGISGPGGLRAALDSGLTSACALLDAAQAAMDAAGPETRGTMLRRFDERARVDAESADRRLEAGERGPLLGVPVSVKDLFDVAGQRTTAGSIVLEDAVPATEDSLVVARLRAAGAVIVGHTSMTEFAYSGVGLNPHHGTPLNPWDRATGRIPGGSSSGAAVALAEGFCALSIGTDTGGSVRIPSALCGLIGFKPTQSTVPREGVFPLSPTLDSVGPLARSVEDACLALEILADVPRPPVDPVATAARFLVPTNLVTEGIDATVKGAFGKALERLRSAGWEINEAHLPALELTREMASIGNYPGLEAWTAHRDRLAARGDAYDPRVRSRIEAGGRLATDAGARLDALRTRYIAEMTRSLEGYDGFLMPTVPVVAPALSDFDQDAEFGRLNLLLLRNPTLINLLDGCAASIPISVENEAPVGLGLCGLRGQDWQILSLAKQAESVVSRFHSFGC